MANKLRLNERFIEITCERNDTETYLKATQIPYIHINRNRTNFRTSTRNIDVVLKLFRNIDASNIDKVPAQIQYLYDKEMRRRVDTNTLIELGPDHEHEVLMRHQQLGVELSHINDRYAFFYDTRTGKTLMSLEIILQDILRNPEHKWLVLCPLILIENAWKEDIAKFFPDMEVVSLHATTKAQRLKQFAKKANIYICNIESFVAYRDHIDKLGIHGCIVDESSAMKSNSSKFSKEAVDYAYTVKRWYLLSGTPAPNGEWEFYRQLQSIDYYGIHSSYAQFKRHFFDNVSHNPQYEKLRVKAERYSELLELIRGYSIYVDKEDVLTTPGRDFIPVEVTMPDELKEKYNQLRRELSLELGESVSITSPSTAGNLNKLNQMSSGFIIDTEAKLHNKMVSSNNLEEPLRKETHLLSTYRFEALYQLLESLDGKQAIIWCTYRKEFEVIKRHLGDDCGLVYGGVNIQEKNDNILAFKQGKIKYLVANPASCDKGLTLTNAHISIYFSLSYSYELWKQSIERIYGDIRSQPNKCYYYIFLARGSVDTAIYTSVLNKGDISLAVLDHLKGGI